MKFQQILHYKNLAYTLISIFLPMLISMFALSACSTGNSVVTSPTPTPTPTQVATEPATPQSLPRGSNEVLYLTNKSTSIANVGGDFYASHPYIVYALCTGSGKLMVEYMPGGSSTFNCSQPAQLYGNQVGNAQNPPTPENLHVQVTLDGQATWEVSIQWQS